MVSKIAKIVEWNRYEEKGNNFFDRGDFTYIFFAVKHKNGNGNHS